MIDSILQIINISTIYFFILGFVIIVLSGIISDSISSGKSLLISILSVIIPLFFLINYISDIETMRLVVGVLIFTFIIPISITYTVLWIVSSNYTNIVRLAYGSFIGWWSSLFIIEIIQLITGWGEFNSIVTISLLIIFYSVLIGLLGSIIGKIILNILNIYRPEKSMYQH